MVEQAELLSFLEYIALIAPAIAVLMQLSLRFQRGSDQEGNKAAPVSFKLLQLSLLCTVIGGLLISSRLLMTISDPFILLGAGLVVIALLLLPFSILLIDSTWGISLSSLSKEDVAKNGANRLRLVGSVILSVLFCAGIFGGVFWIGQMAVDSYVQYGFLRGNDIITPSIFYGIILLFLYVRVLIILWNEGSLLQTHIQDTFTESLILSLSILVFYAAIVGSLYILAIILE